MVFNRIYDSVIKQGIKNPLIICSGGKTDMFKPYKRTEGEEIVKYLKKLATLFDLKTITKTWQFVAEKRSLSTLENFINCKKILERRKIAKAEVTIFCEQTRAKRVRLVSSKVFGKNYKLKVEPIDFDVSANRYLDPKFIAKKEKAELDHSLWALKSSENLKKHHQLFQSKIDYLREKGPNVHVDEVKKWWEAQLQQLADS